MRLGCQVPGIPDRGIWSPDRQSAQFARAHVAAYEVGRDFEGRFLDDNPTNAAFFQAGKDQDHVHFNLPRYCLNRLKNAGIVHSQVVGPCTFSNESHFFSYRRSVHRKDPDYGRQISAIVVL